MPAGADALALHAELNEARVDEPAAEALHALGAPLRGDGQRPLHPRFERLESFGCAAQSFLRRLAREPLRRAREADAAAVLCAQNGVGEMARGDVEALAGQGDDLLWQRQRAGQRAKLGAAALDEAKHRTGMAAAKIGDDCQQFEPHRDRLFGGAGRRWRAQIGGVVDQRPVGFVADGGNQRNEARRGGADDDLLVEAPEVFERAAAARDDEDVRAPQRPFQWKRAEAGDGGGDLCRRSFALNPHRPDQHMAREAVLEPMQDVADDGAGR